MSRIASSGEDKNPKHGLGLAVLLVDQRLDEFDDPLLPGYGRVQPAAHLDEPAINLVEAPINLLEVSLELPAPRGRGYRRADAKMAPRISA